MAIQQKPQHAQRPVQKPQVPQNQPAAPAAPVASAAPGTQDEAGKKEKKVRPDYPGLKNAAGEAVKLKEVPKDYSMRLHRPLKRTDFEDESFFLEWKASEFERRARSLRQEADEYRRMGSVQDRKQAKRLVAVMKRMDELKKTLAADGVDVDALLKRFMEAQEAKQAEVETATA